MTVLIFQLYCGLFLLSQQNYFLLPMTKVVFWFEEKLFGFGIDRAVSCTPDLWIEVYAKVAVTVNYPHFPLRGRQQLHVFQSQSNLISRRNKFKKGYENVGAFLEVILHD